MVDILWGFCHVDSSFRRLHLYGIFVPVYVCSNSKADVGTLPSCVLHAPFRLYLSSLQACVMDMYVDIGYSGVVPISVYTLQPG